MDSLKEIIVLSSRYGVMDNINITTLVQITVGVLTDADNSLTLGTLIQPTHCMAAVLQLRVGRTGRTGQREGGGM